MRIGFMLSWIAVLLLASCTESGARRGPVVLAAASMQEALEQIAHEWELEGNPRPVLSFAGTPALARQIEGGAPADMFISADQDWMDRLESRGLVLADTRMDLVENKLVLVGGPGWRGGEWLPSIELADMVGDARLAVADTRSVPAGRYARIALERLGQWETLEGRLVPTESVRAALSLVERGQAELGIVYKTDQAASDRVELLGAFPGEATPPIRYPVASLAGSNHPDASGFMAFLRSARAQEIFRAHGFGIVR